MRVLVNGCSHIAGSELAEDPRDSRLLSWPNHINEWQHVTNIAEPGSSNDSITRRTINALETQLYDFVCIQWTHFDRLELQIPEWQIKHMQSEWFCINCGNADTMHPHLNGQGSVIYDIAKNLYFDQFNIEWLENYSLSQIVTLQAYLQNRNIKFLFVFSSDLVDNSRASLISRSNIIDQSWLTYCQRGGFKRIPTHYDLQAHVSFADYVRIKIKEIR